MSIRKKSEVSHLSKKVKMFAKLKITTAAHLKHCIDSLFYTPSIAPIPFNNLQVRSKKTQSSSESDKSEDWDSKIVDKNTKLMNINVNSLRVDGLIKSSLGIARNKIDTLFYDGKIRVNGEKMSKKSVMGREGDEIDIIKGVNEKTNFLTVARVELLDIREKDEGFLVKIRRCKSLVVENYN